MQETTPSIPHWAFQVLQTLATLGAGGIGLKLIEVYVNRKKPQAEVHETEARTAEITARSNAVAVNSTIRLMDRLDVALSETDRIRKERNDYKQISETQESELKSYEMQMRRMESIMRLNGIHLSDYDIPKE